MSLGRIVEGLFVLGLCGTVCGQEYGTYMDGVILQACLISGLY